MPAMALVALYQGLPPLAKAALGAVVALQSLALLAWGWWLVAEIRADSVRAKEKKDK